MQKIAALEKQFPIHPDFSFIDLASDYPAILINNAHAKAAIALHGAHLTDYTPHNEAPVIFTSNAAVYREGKAIRGGIPICWPWFNDHPTDSSLPSHGYARTSFWNLDSIEHYSSGTSLIFSLPPQGNSSLSVKLEFHIGETLILTLTTTNDGNTPEIYSEALHAYFSVNDSRQTELHGLDGRKYIDTVGEETQSTQHGVLTFPGEVDSIYHNDAETTLKDLTSKREVFLSKTGSNTTIAWNPGIKKGGAMSDLNDDEIHKFVCIEAGNARQHSIQLESGQ